MSKSKKCDIELSKINRKSYNYYEEIQDYEYSYVIAEQMLFRTKSFKELFETKIEDRKEKWIKKATALGLDTYNAKMNFTLKKNELILLNQDPHSYTINDLTEGKDALFNLIDYYYRKNKIYVINFKKNILSTNFLEEVTFDEVYKDFDNYFIPCKDLKSRYENIIIKPISKKLLLRELEDSFLDTLSLKDIIGFNGVINQYWNKEPLICDLGEDALSDLIAFYNEDSRIYRAIKNIKTKKIDYVKINNPNNIYILLNHHNYFIPCRVRKDNKIVIEYKVLSDKIPLFEIDESNKRAEKKFSAKIKLSEIEYLENEVSNSLTINNIYGGFNKLINYYIEKGKIYSQKLSKKTKNKFKHCNIKKYYKNEISPMQKIVNKYKIKFINKSENKIYSKKDSINNYRKLIFTYKNNRVSLIKKIMNNHDRYYIPLINDNLKGKKTILTQINKNIPLKLLDKNFRKELDFSDIM